MVEGPSSTPKDQLMRETGSMICSTAMAVRHGMKAKSSSRENTTKGKRTAKEDTSGPTEATTKVILWTAFSRAQVSIF